MNARIQAQRAATIDALLEGVGPREIDACRKLLTHIMLMDAGDFKMSLPMARRAIDYISPLLDPHEAAEEIVRFCNNSTKFSTVFEDHYMGRFADPEADYLAALTRVFVAQWNLTHPQTS